VGVPDVALIVSGPAMLTRVFNITLPVPVGDKLTLPAVELPCIETSAPVFELGFIKIPPPGVVINPEAEPAEIIVLTMKLCWHQ